jgi:uncharacterized protein
MLNLFRKDKANFFMLIADEANEVLAGMIALREYAKNQTEDNAKRVIEFENRADEARRILIDELNKTFATPIDREDLFALSKTIDDIMDYGKSTLDELEMFELKADVHIVKMTELLLSGVKEIDDAVRRLEKNPTIAVEHAVRAKKFENEMEKVYRNALVELFKGTDVIHMLKMREIYRHLSNAADRIDEAGDEINSIVVKTT